MQAIASGKAVLVEKPFTMTGDEAEDIADAARRTGTFCLEAMWARFNPHLVRVREVLASGELGEITTVLADHGQWFARDRESRLFAPELGGGALLDLGIYPVSFASMVLGTPTRVTARATSAFTGVDAQTSILLEHAGGAHAVLTTTLRAVTPTTATIVGTQGRLEIDGPFYAPGGFTVTPRQGTPWRYDEPHEGLGLRHEAAEVVRCLREGLTESKVLPLDETVSIMRTLDEVRRQTADDLHVD
jgi:predicted dehydrogenase